MKPLEIEIVREVFGPPLGLREGFTLGRIFVDGVFYGYTVEDQDRYLEVGGTKVFGKTAMPAGRYLITLYNSPKHGLVPLFNDVPQFSYTEIHRANTAEELQGCVAVGKARTATGVANCAAVLQRLVDAIQIAEDEGRACYCTIRRAERA